MIVKALTVRVFVPNRPILACFVPERVWFGTSTLTVRAFNFFDFRLFLYIAHMCGYAMRVRVDRIDSAVTARTVSNDSVSAAAGGGANETADLKSNNVTTAASAVSTTTVSHRRYCVLSAAATARSDLLQLTQTVCFRVTYVLVACSASACDSASHCSGCGDWRPDYVRSSDRVFCCGVESAGGCAGALFDDEKYKSGPFDGHKPRYWHLCETAEQRRFWCYDWLQRVMRTGAWRTVPDSTGHAFRVHLPLCAVARIRYLVGQLTVASD